MDSTFKLDSVLMWFDQREAIAAAQSLLKYITLGLGAAGAPQGDGRVGSHKEAPSQHSQSVIRAHWKAALTQCRGLDWN